MGRPRKFLESDVVASAGRAFSANGYDGTTLDDLVNATGIGKQSLYNSFGDKRELFLRALAAGTIDAVAAVDEALAASDLTPLERIRAHLFKLAITFGEKGSPGSLITQATVELAHRDTEVAESTLSAFKSLEEVYATCLRDAQQAGEIDADADPDALATFFLALTSGMELLGSAGVGRAELTTVALASLNVMSVRR